MLKRVNFTGVGVKETVETFWKYSLGLVLIDTYEAEIPGEASASYLNWPMISTNVPQAELEGLITDLGVNYVLVLAEQRPSGVVDKLNSLNLPAGKSLMVREFAVEEELGGNGLAKGFNKILRAFGEKPDSIVVTNSWDLSIQH